MGRIIAFSKYENYKVQKIIFFIECLLIKGYPYFYIWPNKFFKIVQNANKTPTTPHQIVLGYILYEQTHT